jgi:hypothetical protein
VAAEVDPNHVVDRNAVPSVGEGADAIEELDYSPAWLSCLDESMNSWLNKFCLGFMICPRKPWPFGNEYHSIADSNENMQHPIMWRIRLVEGKDRPKLGNGRWAFPTQWENEWKTKTVKLLFNMTALVHWTGKVVTWFCRFTLDSAH